MSDLGFKSRGELLSFIRNNIALDPPTIGRSSVTNYNLRPSFYKFYGTPVNIPSGVSTAYTGWVSPATSTDHVGDDSLVTYTNSGLFTIRKNQVIGIKFGWGWALNAAGSRQVAMRFNGTTWPPYSDVRWPSGAGVSAGTFDTMDLWKAGDLIEVIAFQDSGATLTLQVDATFYYFTTPGYVAPS